MRALLLAVVFLVTSLFARPLYADDVADEADHLFTLGAEHYQQKDFKGALQYFLASNRLVRNRNVMFNIAKTYEHLNEPADAYRYYQRALDGETDASIKERVKSAMARLGPSVALLKVETDPPGATLYLNRKDLGDRGTSPQTIALAPGSYTVIAELAGYDDVTSAKVEIRIGAEKAVSLKLTRVVGTLRISGANGAQVRIDADDAPVLCEAPCDAAVPPGQHTLILTKPGFKPTRQNVQVRANQVTSVTPGIEAETGSLIVNADERDAAIEIDGKTQGFTPAVLTVPVGKHVLHVGLRGFRAVDREIEIKSGEQTQVDLQLFTADAVEAASRLSEPVEDAPASVSLITSPELRAMHYPTVAEAVRGTRGVYTSYDTAYRSVGFRGFNRPGDYGNRVLMLVDGHPLNDNWLWSSYVGYDLRADIEDVERIEIVRGPGSVLYGTGAFSGVINLVSHARDTPDGREVGVSVADDAVARARIRFTHHWSKDAGVSTSVAMGRGEGSDYFFPEFVRRGPAGVAGHARGIDGFKVATWSGKAFYKAFQAQWSVNHHDKTIPVGAFDTIFGDGRAWQTDSRGFIELKFEPQITDWLSSISRVHANVYIYRAELPRVPNQGGIEYSKFNGFWAGAEQRFVASPIKQLRFTAGGEIQHHPLAEQIGGSETLGEDFDDKKPFSLGAGYLLADVIPTSRLKISAGARADAYFGSLTTGSVNPRLAIIVKPYEGGNIKIMGGKAFRSPSLYELYNISIGGQKENTNLKPENLYNAEIELSHRFTPTVIATASAYASYITDLIALRPVNNTNPDNPTLTYTNTAVPVASIGGELELRREWKEGWMASASYSYQKSRYLVSDEFGDLLKFKTATGLREVPNSPSHLAYVKGAVPLISRALVLMTRLGFEGPRFDVNDTNGTAPQTETRPAFLWDAVFSGTESRWGLHYALGVYNLFDARWRVPVSAEYRPLSIPQLGRSLLAFASVVF